jgi:hypothetical protein
MIIYTFCVDVGRFPISTLIEALNIWLNSIMRSGTNAKKIIVYSNLKIVPRNAPHPPEFIEIREFIESEEFLEQMSNNPKMGSWASLICHKFYYWEKIYDEEGKFPTWIDLDTFVCGDLSAIDDYDNFFTALGSNDDRIMYLTKDSSDHPVKRCDYLNGGVFKFNSGLHRAATNTLMRYGEILKLPEQDAINYIYHFEGMSMNILGRDIDRDSVNSFEAWNTDIAEHINCENCKHLLVNEEGILRSDLHEHRKVNFIQFTFKRFNEFLSLPQSEWSQFVKHWQSFRLNKIFNVAPGGS